MNTASITVTNYVAAIIVSIIALSTIHMVVSNITSSTQAGTDKNAANELKNKINSVCEDRQGAAEGQVQFTSDTKLVLEDTRLELTGDEDLEEEMEVSCPIDSRKELEGSVSYTITETSGGYSLR